MAVSDDNTGLHRSTCLYISTKGTEIHVIMPTDEYKVKMFLCGITDAHDKCGGKKPFGT